MVKISRLTSSDLELRTWNPMWSGKSQLSRSEWLRLHKLISSDLGLRTWNPCEPALNFKVLVSQNGVWSSKRLGPHGILSNLFPIVLLLGASLFVGGNKGRLSWIFSTSGLATDPQRPSYVCSTAPTAVASPVFSYNIIILYFQL